MKYDLIVVGGGASGMIASGRAAERGLKVLLLEKNDRLGEKLRISGGGRCNITNAEENTKLLLGKYGKAEKYLYSLFAQFGMKETFNFFEMRSLPLKVEAGKRAFPVSEKASDVVAVLEEYLKKGRVDIRYQSPVTKVLTSDSRIEAVFCGDTRFEAREYIFATGSISHPETGSTGDGFRWLKKIGHTIALPTPTIVPLAVKEKWVKTLMGVTLEEVRIHFFVEKEKQFSLSGNILCTHFGLSGPLILNAAHKVADLLHRGRVTAAIDTCPKVDLGTLEQSIITLFDKNKNKVLKNILKECIPTGTEKGLSLLLVEKIDLNKKVHSVTKEERKKLVQLLKALPVTIQGLMGFDRAVVADGGVELNEIDWKTMRSRKIANLLVTGDLLHINRPSGGYSLQLCWSTGYVAGSHAGK
ncbi:MAG: aminoacetone oxidase family FAD-binding enzyme [Candidatus Moranbacteria bacterium]|nr:aminoacetone oxidase family FAD-binding enzyme [Candidatus Moranbacteria bacterium]